jgi:hypothetical protein
MFPFAVNKFGIIYGTRKFITVFTNAFHRSLFTARLIQSYHTILSCLSEIHFNIIWLLRGQSLFGFLTHQYPDSNSIFFGTLPGLLRGQSLFGFLTYQNKHSNSIFLALFLGILEANLFLAFLPTKIHIQISSVTFMLHAMP